MLLALVAALCVHNASAAFYSDKVNIIYRPLEAAGVGCAPTEPVQADGLLSRGRAALTVCSPLSHHCPACIRVRIRTSGCGMMPSWNSAVGREDAGLDDGNIASKGCGSSPCHKRVAAPRREPHVYFLLAPPPCPAHGMHPIRANNLARVLLLGFILPLHTKALSTHAISLAPPASVHACSSLPLPSQKPWTLNPKLDNLNFQGLKNTFRRFPLQLDNKRQVLAQAVAGRTDLEAQPQVLALQGPTTANAVGLGLALP